MTGHRRLSKSMTAFDKDKVNVAREFPGILGATFKGQSLVEVPNRAGFVYLRLRSNISEVIQAFNENVSPVYDLPVTVVRDQANNRYYVKGRDVGRYQTWGGSSSYQPRHGAQHSFPDNNWGGDIVWVYGRQFVPGSISPPSGTAGANYVYINPSIFYINDEWHYGGGLNTSNLTVYNPTGTGARMVIVYLDADGNPAYMPGAEFSQSYITKSDIIPYLPSFTGSFGIPLGAVRLLSGTSIIGWNEIYDLRPLVSQSGDVIVGSGHTIQNEGTPLTQRGNLNFVGTTVWAEDDAGNNATKIIISGSTSGMSTGTVGHVIQDEGTPLTQRSGLNFIGTTVWVEDDSGNNATKIIISGSSSGHDPVTLDADAAALLDLSSQQLGLDTQAINKVFASPPTGTTPDEPTFRSLVAADVGSGAPNGLKFLRDDMSWQVPSITGSTAGHTIQNEGTPVTNRSNLNFIGSTVFVEDDAGNNATKIIISGSASSHDPVTLDADADALLDLSGQQLGLDTQAVNKFFASPPTGTSADEPTFRSIVSKDLGSGTPNGLKFLRDDLTWQVPSVTGSSAGAPSDAKYIVGEAHDDLSDEIVVPFYLTHPDKKPASPTAYDDEFDGNSLDAKWTTFLPHATLTVANSLCNIAGASTGTDHRTQGIEQTITGAWKFRCKVFKNCGMAFFRAFCLGVRDSSTDRVRYLALMDHSTYGAGAIVETWGVGWSSSTIAGETNRNNNLYGQLFYFEMEHDANTVYWRVSEDGHNYLEIFSATDASYVENPDRVGFGIYTYNQAANYSIDWFRKV